MPVGFHMGMGRVGLVKTAPIPINTIPACKQFGKKPMVFSYQDHKSAMLCYKGSTIAAHRPPSLDTGLDRWQGGMGMQQ